MEIRDQKLWSLAASQQLLKELKGNKQIVCRYCLKPRQGMFERNDGLYILFNVQTRAEELK